MKGVLIALALRLLVWGGALWAVYDGSRLALVLVCGALIAGLELVAFTSPVIFPGRRQR